MAMDPNRTSRAFRAIAVQYFVNGAVWATFASRLPAIRDRSGVSVGVLGAVLMLGNLSSLVGSLFTDRLLARVPSRRVMIGGGAFYVAALPLVGTSQSAVVLVVGLVIMLWFDVFIDVAMSVQGSYVSATRHTPVMNRLTGLWSLGTVAGGSVSVWVAHQGIGTPMHFLGAAAVLACALILVSRGLLPTDEPHPGQLPARAPRSASAWPWRPSAAAIVLGASSALAVVLDVTPGDWATFRLADDLGSSPQTAVGGFLMFTAGMTTGRLLGDLVQVRVGRARLASICAALAFTGLGVATLVAHEWIVLAGFLAAGLGTSVFAAQLADRAARAPGPIGSGFKVLFVGHRIAALATPISIGALAGTDAIGVGAAMAMVGLPAAAVLGLTARRSFADS